MQLSKLLSIRGLDLSLVLKIALVPNQHHNQLLFSIISYLSQPSLYILESWLFGDIIDQQRSQSAFVVGTGDCSEPFLPSRIPDLSLDDLLIHGHLLGIKLNPNGSLWLGIELIVHKPWQEVGLSYTWVALNGISLYQIQSYL